MIKIKDTNTFMGLPADDCELVTLNLDIKAESRKFEYISRNNYREYNSNYGYLFTKVLESNTVVWKARCTTEFATTVLVCEGDDKCILVIPYDNNMILFSQLKDNTWNRINTEINMNKLRMIERLNYMCRWKSYGKYGELSDFPRLRDLYRFSEYNYDLDKHNFKIVFNNLCDRVIYGNNLVWIYKDDPFQPYPDYLNFNLVDKTVNAVLKNGTVEVLYLNLLSHKRPRYNQSVDSVHPISNTEEKRVKKRRTSQKLKKSTIKQPGSNQSVDSVHPISNTEEKRVKKEPISVDLIFLDADMIMSTNEYKTFCGPDFYYFKANSGILFGKIIDDGKVIFDTEDPTKYVAEYKSRLKIDRKINKKIEFFKFLKPNIDKFKFYTSKDILLKHEDYRVEHAKDYYKINFHKDLNKITYNDKIYWEYDYYKHEYLPTSVYFTNSDNNMTLVFSNGVERDIKISCNLLKMYKLQNSNSENSKMEMEEGDCEVIKPEYNKRLYTLRDDIKCTKVSYDEMVVWEHKPGKEYPKSISCEYNLARIDIRFNSYIGSFAILEGCNSFTQFLCFPTDLKLYQENENGNSMELNQNDYRINVLSPSSIEYIIKPIKCNEIRFGDSTLWKRENGQPFPRKIIRNFEVPSILVYDECNSHDNLPKLIEIKIKKEFCKLEQDT
ncbi:hypothetical protein TpMuguga_01g00464 [Theileria parva strain Muguga]|uniref:Uncharacterized protein n=1 Tax=Theileria parva TaxID=5875 RepID=Q4N8K7_THEPA|nr:uncharacterized protein TpMuguga_01g00464 [Theileria parva strain Muguga]EAN33701.1 hypothetical protein TpMuguga_01g00464 [Theileria parva strain Muguga]|eukprot:XP_765984.1 hypothetical protein [Theileria parva strain Muguga]